MRRLLISGISVLSCALACRADDWPSWRGPDALGVSAEKDLPIEWSAEKGVALSIAIPEWGNSAPVVVQGSVYVTAQTEDSVLHLLCLDARSGDLRWQRPAGKGKLKSHELHNMATPTPAADRERIACLFGTGDLVCFDPKGEVLWRRDLVKDHGDYKILWGMGSSPLMLDGRIFVVCMHAGPSYVLAVDAKTGEDRWKRPRDLPCIGEATDSYSSPVLARQEGRVELIVAGADHVNAYDPASGDELWIASGLKIEHRFGRSIASPTFGGGHVVAPSSNFSNLGRVISIPAGGRGDVTSSRRWSYDKASPDCPTPLVYDGLVYLVRDDGIASCLDLKTGEVAWSRRLFRGDVKASPVAGDGKVYFLAVSGEAAVIAHGREGKELARNRLEGRFIATPAVSGGRIWMRSRDRLWAAGK